jgi:ADP-dependent NAD(P)H-hydrate dehydratase / NAD(P)H-hydrate epimerase
LTVIYLHTAAQSRAADIRAITELGVTGFELMLRAGRFALDRLLAAWPAAGVISIFAGKGNNAGDGYVMAALAIDLGLRAEIIQVGTAPSAGDALLAVRYAAQRFVPVIPFAVDYLANGKGGAVLVDALLGTGQAGPPRGDFALAVAALNASGRPVLAVDIPTGLNADTGGACGEDAASVVRAEFTATFITRKLGQYTGLGRQVCGHVCFDSLGVDPRWCDGGVPLVDTVPARAPLSVHAYKHQRGHVVIAGGDLSMGGAVLLAGEAALRAGAGMVTIITRPEHRPAILARRPELMVMDAEDDVAVKSVLDRATCVVLGPGLDRRQWGRSLYQAVTGVTRVPVLLDADGFHHWLESSRTFRPAIATPHVAEAARLLATSAASVQHDRPAAARALVQRVGDVVVLKGAGSLVADHGSLTVCGAGNPSMASAGMGDVLCGIIAAQIADSHSLYAAVVRGVVLHSVAGDNAVLRGSTHSLLASDLIDELRLLA